MAEQVEAQPGRSNGYDPAAALKFIERIERLEEEKKATAADIKEVKIEASEAGIETKVLNEILRDRRKRETLGDEKYDEFTNGVDMLKHALGEFGSTPLGEAALTAVQ